MASPALRPLRIGEILDASIKIYRTNARTLIGLAAIVVIPFQVLSGLVILSIVPSTADLPNGYSALSNLGHATPSPDPAATTGANAILSITSLIATLLVTGACVKAVSDVYLDQPVGFRASLRFAARRLHSLLWLEILFVLGLIVAFCALIIPSIYLYFAWALAAPALLIEGRRGRRALGRSRQLVKGRWWPTAAVLLLAAVLTSVFSSIFEGIVLGVVFSTSDSLIVGVALVTLSAAIASTLAQPFQAAVTTMLYYDLRVRKEGYDVELLAEQLGLEPATLPGPGYLGPESVGQPGGPPYWPPPPGWVPGQEEPPAPAV